MLKLERMQLSGFKSFSDRTEVRFPGGITAIVGPNGCGKSNIGDAINWVLGEQSAKMLRGKHMSDVIFNGSRSRKPQGLAEVSLRFSGAEGIVGNDQGTIAITRRLFRSGESEYLLNGAKARLKDIQEILRQARVGTKTYATIEQGKIDQVLNAKPKDRRLMIEDAAGVAGYKHKRRLTELKLEATLANLLRVNDIVSEVRRQINTLKRQAAKARRYRKLREEYRSRETLRFALRTRSLEQDLERARETEAQLRDGEAGAAGELARQEVSIAEERAALDEAVRAHRGLAERLHQVEIEIDRKESQIQACRERIGESELSSSRKTDESEQLASRLEELKSRQQEHRKQVVDGRADAERLARELAEHQAELDRVQGTLKQQNQEIENLRSRQFEALTGAADLKNRLHRIEESTTRQQQQSERLGTERGGVLEDWTRLEGESTRLLETAQEQAMRREVLQAGFDKSEQQLKEARAHQADETERLTEARESEKAAQTKLHTLQDVETRFAGVSDGVRALLGEGSTADVGAHGVVADFVDAGAEIEVAAEGYLHSILPAVIVEDDHAVERAADFLRGSGAGGASFISRTQPVGGLAVGSPQNGSGPVPQTILDDQRVLGRLRDRVSLKSSVNGVVQNRIGDAVLVDNLRSGLELHRVHPAADYLTLDGDVVHASGVVTVAGSADANKGLLAHKRRVEEADTDVRSAAEHSARVHETVDVSRRHVERLEIEVQEQRQALDDSSRRALEVELQSQQVAEERDRIGRRRDVLADEIAMLDEDVKRLTLEQLEALGELAQAEESRQGVQSALETHTAVSGEGQDRVQQLAEAVATLRAEQAARGERQQGIEQEQERLALEVSELGSRIESLRSELSQAMARAREAAELQTRTESDLLAQLEERKALTAKSGGFEREVADRQQNVELGDVALRTGRSELEKLRERTREAELERTRIESDRTHLDDLCAQELGSTAKEALAAATEEFEEMDGVEIEALEREIEDIRLKLERIGPVNMTAIEEFSELEERYEFLSSQHDDLDHSMNSMKESIRRINRQSRERFIEAFEAIRASYQEIFKLLFVGGRGDLRLEEGEDVLECGIEIMAQPPGKRLASVQLMSGGEKALSAIALLFSIFRYQPSPFCLLDEVDAALDDANVGRFSRMLGEYADQTQFIIVTHNKLSMESADLLYGVTMEEPGISKVVSLQLN